MEEDEVPEGESGQSLELEDWGGGGRGRGGSGGDIVVVDNINGRQGGLRNCASCGEGRGG